MRILSLVRFTLMRTFLLVRTVCTAQFSTIFSISVFITLHYRYSTLNLYEFDFYAGADQYFYGDDPSYDPSKVSGNSAVVTGCDAWTIYEYDSSRVTI